MVGMLDGKVALVTGAGRGIGRGISLAYAAQGAKVAVTGRTARFVHDTAAEIERRGGTALAVPADVKNPDDIARAVAATAEAFGGIDVLVNNASEGHGVDPLETISDEEFLSVFESAPLATFRMMKACFPYLKASKGKVINFGSPGAMMGMEGMAAYAAAKEAVRGLSKVAAREWGKYGINVNVIAPAAYSDGAAAFSEANPELYRSMVAMRPLGRDGDCESDIGGAAVFLASSLSGYLTGECLQVAGGVLIVP